MTAMPRLEPIEEPRIAVADRDDLPFAAPAWEALGEPSEPARYRSKRTPRQRSYTGALAFALLSGAIIAVTWLAPATALDAAASGIEWLRAHTGDSGDTGRAALTTVLAAAALLALIGAWGRATSRRRPVRLRDGRGRVRVEEIAAGLRAVLLERHDVHDVAVSVENHHRRGLRVALLLHVTPDARLADTLDGATAAAEQLIHGRIGVPMTAPPLIELRYEELELRPGRAHA